jgi:hypothetical protein
MPDTSDPEQQLPLLAQNFADAAVKLIECNVDPAKKWMLAGSLITQKVDQLTAFKELVKLLNYASQS